MDINDLEKQIATLNEKNLSLEKQCDNIFDQLTEIRTTIQEIYGESHKSERFLCKEMLKISKRLEEMSKDINYKENIVNVSPQINPIINQNPTITSTKNICNPSEEKNKKKLLLFNDDDSTFKIIISAIIGFLVLLGIISVFIFKLIYFITEMFN